MSVGRKTAVIISIVLVFTVIGAAAWFFGRTMIQNQAQKPPLSPSLDQQGVYLILATPQAGRLYHQAISSLRELHPQADQAEFNLSDWSANLKMLRKKRPRYIAFFILPGELDVNLVWAWLRLCTEVDDDPFVDVMTGFFTGESPAVVLNFVERIQKVLAGDLILPAVMVDNLGPNQAVKPTHFSKKPFSFFLPVYRSRFKVFTISHGLKGFGSKQLGTMDQAGILHFGGHGYPDRVVDSLDGLRLRIMPMAPSVVFNGACYTGVTERWFDMASGHLEEKQVVANRSFCLAMLANQTVGYLAALHADHGIPVYQEMELLSYTGASLGQVIKATQNGVIIANNGRLPDLVPLASKQALSWSPSDFMMRGTAARALFGDPAFVPIAPFTDPPFEFSYDEIDEKSLRLTAILKNDQLKSTFTDTYYNDLCRDQAPFNDMARVIAPLPEGWDNVGKVEVKKVSIGGKNLPHDLKGFGLEKDHGRTIFHAQVDLPARGYMSSPFRTKGARVELELSR